MRKLELRTVLPREHHTGADDVVLERWTMPTPAGPSFVFLVKSEDGTLDAGFLQALATTLRQKVAPANAFLVHMPEKCELEVYALDPDT